MKKRSRISPKSVRKNDDQEKSTASKAFIEGLAEIFPIDRLLTEPAQLIPYESDALTAHQGRPLAVVVPESAEEVIQSVRLCHHHRIPFTARGSGTSLSGGAMPVDGGLLIAMNRLNRILHIDPLDRIAIVEPGVINIAVSQVAAQYGLYYAPDPASQVISTIGGNLAFNAGGVHCLKNGMTSNHILGLQVVLPDGEVVELGGESLESISPDLVGLFVGSEGLFGIALQATLRLIPRPESYKTVLAAYNSLENAGRAVGRIIGAGLLPGALEIMDHLAIVAAEAAVHPGYPDQAAILIVELEGDQQQVSYEFERLMDVIQGSEPDEVHIAQDEAERLRIWKGRKSAFAAVGRLSPEYLVNDGVVPRSRLGAALAEIERLAQQHGLRVANVFHAGDGNLHPLILFDGRNPGELERARLISGEILKLCIQFGGSITGEHGIGIEKLDYLPKMYNPVDMDVMQQLRCSIDPFELANRGKMLPVQAERGVQ